MGVSDANESPEHIRSKPILIPDDIPSGGNTRYDSNLTPNASLEFENPLVIAFEGLSTNHSNAASSQTESVSQQSTPTSCIHNRSSSFLHTHSETMNSTRRLSTVQRMMDLESAIRSVANDYRALEEADLTFHKQAWRERVAQWCYDVLDYLEESRDVASVAMNIIDRYLAVLSKESLPTPLVIGEFDYEVISFTALFLAIRVSGSNKELEISSLLNLSSSTEAPQVRHIVSAGNIMLKKLSWNHQILTPKSFLRELVGLLMIQDCKNESNTTETMSDESVSKLFDFASYLVEVSVCDIYFSSIAPSKVAFGALTLATMCHSDLLSSGCGHKQCLTRFLHIVNKQTSLNIECPHMNAIIGRLLNVYNQSQEAVAGNVERKIIQGEGLSENNSYNTNLPHIIVDEGDTSNTIDEDILLDQNEDHLPRLNGDEDSVNMKQSRPVSPYPPGFT